MWPFKKKTEAKPKADNASLSADLLRAFRKPGETFNWLGSTMLVCSISRNYLGCGIFRPVMECNYRDNNGEIQVLYFDVSDLDAMYAQNPPRGDLLPEEKR